MATTEILLILLLIASIVPAKMYDSV